ncbi:MAG: outer membrane lipoprotein carrier protein LolA [Acidobacteria bacterium]|nr:outer membrane lipoprotein carrier protein LolA [Acidobacteriota bacterium]
MALQQSRAFVVAAGMCAAALLTHAAQRDLFDEIYLRGQPIAGDLKTLTARFTESSTSSLLAKPLVAQGTLAVLRPSTMILRYTDPERRTVLIEGDVMRVIWPARAIDRRTAIGTAQRRIQQYFVDKSPSQLRSHFDITARVADDRAGTWRIAMTPRRQQVKQGLAALELWLDREALLLAAMRMTFPNGDTKLMEFADVTVNPPIDPSVFRVTP